VAVADPSVGDLLSLPGENTVFGPDNNAFYTSGVLADIDADGATELLSYHAYPGLVDSASVPARADSLLMNRFGFALPAVFDTTTGVVVNAHATVTTADITTTNGILHIIDDVLLPPDVVDMVDYAGLTSLSGGIASSTQLSAALRSAGPFTMFAPDDAAFAYDAKLVASWSPLELQSVLSYHLIGGFAPLDSASMFTGDFQTLLFPETVAIDTTVSVMVNDATVTNADLHATNGVVHVIDKVLVPVNIPN
jgi:transforming growth factor-beta-induced protein